MCINSSHVKYGLIPQFPELLVSSRHWNNAWSTVCKAQKSQIRAKEMMRWNISTDRHGNASFLSGCVSVMFHPPWEVWFMHRQVSVIWGIYLNISNYINANVLYRLVHNNMVSGNVISNSTYSGGHHTQTIRFRKSCVLVDVLPNHKLPSSANNISVLFQ